MKKKKLELADLEGKEIIVLRSKDEKFDFKGSSLMVEARFDNPRETVLKFAADGWVSGIRETKVIRLDIPRDSSSVKMVLSSGWGREDLTSIEAHAESVMQVVNKK